MAGIYYEKGDKHKVIESYQTGLQANPDDVQLNMMLASVYELEQQYDQALAIYNAVVANRPDVDLAVNNLVSLLLDHYPGKENTERAVSLAKRFEKSEQPYFLDTYGWALVHNGNVKDALPVFKQVVLKAPEVAVFNYHLGVAYQKNNDPLQAIAALEIALSLAEKQGGFVEKDQATALLKELKAMPAATDKP